MGSAVSLPSIYRDRILALIRESGTSIRALASLSGLPKSTLARQLETGDLPLAHYLALCRALRVDPGDALSTPAELTADARAIADVIRPLSPAERYALRTMIESAVELRTAAVAEDRRHAGEARDRVAVNAGENRTRSAPLDMAALPATIDDDTPHGVRLADVRRRIAADAADTGERRRKGD